MVLQQRPVFREEHHRDAVETYRHVDVSLVVCVLRKPSRRGDLPAFARTLAAFFGHSLVEAVPCVDVYEDHGVVFPCHQVERISAFGLPVALDDLVSATLEKLLRRLDGFFRGFGSLCDKGLA